MLDFISVSAKSYPKLRKIEIYPKFMVKSSNDLMIRGGDFYAIWDEENKTWSTDEEVALHLIDKETSNYIKSYTPPEGYQIYQLCMWDAENGLIDRWHRYVQKQNRDKFKPLDEKIIFSNDEIKKKDYSSKRLTYPLQQGKLTNYNRLMSVLYSDEERRKIEWAIGAIVTGDSKKIQKFLVMYGAAGTGKSTVINIIQELFEGYYSVFDSKALGSASNVFALEAFKSNPLVAIQHDGDLSHIEDNTRLNSVVSHETMVVNEKFKATYSSRFNSFLIMGTNRPVKITDAKSGILRRLIDVRPTGKLIPTKEYNELIEGVKFELGAIAWHCKEVYLSDPRFYDDYIPISMLGASNDFYNYVLDSYDVFKRDNGTGLKSAWEMYKTYCDDAKVLYPMSMRVFKEELKNYFQSFTEGVTEVDGVNVRNYYSGFIFDKFEYRPKKGSKKIVQTLVLDSSVSIFDVEASEYPAQYATKDETPKKKWAEVKTKLKSIDTSKLHYVKVPKNHIVIDFDLKDEEGNKSLALNLEAANRWPETYAELSKGGQGIHLHYIYTGGDPAKLSRLYSEGIEIKVFTGNSSLRRRLTQCNNVPIAEISSGLPLKEEKPVIDFNGVNSERGLRTTIAKCLRKEVHDSTKPNVDFIFKILEDTYNSGMKYDVSDLEPSIIEFALASSNQSQTCLKIVRNMKFKSDEPADYVESKDDGPIIFFDIEVFPNLFLIVWKKQGSDTCIRMFNPSKEQVEELIRHKLVGFNNRGYDNHILYAALQGYDNQGIFETSQRIINNLEGGKFREAYNISYTDVLDFSNQKQSLKKFEIELGLKHMEFESDFNAPLPEELWERAAEYCENDVRATEAVFEARKGDFIAREILAELAGMPVNSSTNSLTTRIIFGTEKHPQLVYTDLSQEFPGYELTYDANNKKKNMYRGVDLGFGGYVYSEPGIYTNVALLDIASMHPNSIRNLNLFGSYTPKFVDLLNARIFIKHKDFEAVRQMFNGKLAPYLDDESLADSLAYALKIAINSVYGLTSAAFANPFRDARNINNIVALRGALFMKTLQDEVQEMGYTVIHIKTDSIKIANADDKIISFCMDFAKKYGYEFEHEATYEKMCLVNKAVYVAKDAKDGHWTATGTQFAVPFVFKTLFSHEQIIFKDYCETKEVSKGGIMYLDFNEDLAEGEHNYHFIGKVGSFVPIKPDCGGGELMVLRGDKYSAVAGSKGFRWLESEMVETLGMKDDIWTDAYHRKLVDEAVAAISQYGDFEWFVS